MPSNFPFFLRYVQQTKENNEKYETLEQEKIFDCVQYFKDKLSYEEVKNKSNFREELTEYSEDDYVNSLHDIKNNILNIRFVNVYSSDDSEGYKMFRDFNTLGINLSWTDLIKGELFSRIGESEGGYDELKKNWADMLSVIAKLNYPEEKYSIEFFFFCLWDALYPNRDVWEVNRHFEDITRNMDDVSLEILAKKITDSSMIFSKMVRPDKDQYKQQHKEKIYDALCAINLLCVKINNINLNQKYEEGLYWPRVLLFSLMMNEHAKDKIVQKFIINYVHYIFVARITNKKSINVLFKKFTKNISSVKNADELKRLLEEFFSQFNQKIQRDTFQNSFIELEFYKGNDRYNSYLSKFAVEYIADKKDGEDHHSNRYSIEHIIDESEGEINIGNLTVLSTKVNNNSSQLKGYSKKKDKYQESEYKLTRELVEKYPDDFTEEDVKKRAEELADYYWNEIFLKLPKM